MTRPAGSVNRVDQEEFREFVKLEAHGYRTPEIIEKLWGVTEESNPSRFGTLKGKCSRWRGFEGYNKIWMEEMGRYGRGLLSAGLRRVREQIDTDEPWLANKAANDAINFAKGRIFGENDRTVTVKFEGMPELGTPDKEE